VLTNLDGEINNGVGDDEFCIKKLHSWMYEVDASGEIILTEVLPSITWSTSLSILILVNICGITIEKCVMNND